LVDLLEFKQIALQWIPGHCQIADNKRADALAKKGAKLTQTHLRETSYRSIKLNLKQDSKVYTDMN
jgi:ribonuclease HI